mgnify:CR=1 FL=1
MGIAVGLIFSLLNLNVVILGKTISLIPDFIGYFLIFRYFYNLKKNDKRNNTIKLLSISLSLYNFTMFIANIFGFKVGIVDVIINILSVAIMFVLFYLITKYFTSELKTVIICLLMNVCVLLSHLTSFSPNVIYLISTVCYMILVVLYIGRINKLERNGI